MGGLFGVLKRKSKEPVVEMLDVDTLRSRIGEPLPPRKPPEEPEYVRPDGRHTEGRGWRKVAGLTR